MKPVKALVRSILRSCGFKIEKIDPKGPRHEQELAEILDFDRRLLPKISPNLEILNGPFNGMRYPSSEITEVCFLSKITGVYEKQLHPLLIDIAEKNYEHILDVGCAEGYYAIGLARLCPDSIVHCFDINHRDLEFCRRMAVLNNVHNVAIEGICLPMTLIDFDYGKRSFILCDCEGFELDLFTDDVIAKLGRADVLIEMHDLLNPEISSVLLERFRSSHEVTIIDNSEIDTSDIKGLESLSREERYAALFEHRGGPYQKRFMEWAFFTARN